jgi:hypothetical protein
LAKLTIIRPSIEECFRRGEHDAAQFARDFLDFNPHDGQVAWLLRSGDPHVPAELRVAKPDAKQANLHAANRWGKTQVIAVELLHRAFYQIRPEKYAFDPMGRLKPYVAVNVSLSLDQAMIAWNYAFALASNAPRFKDFIVDWQGTPFPRLQIGNKGTGDRKIVSEVWARSTSKGAKFLLGKTFNFLSWDEAAFQDDGQEILDGVIRMRLVDQAGDLVLLSSPNGKNYFYQQCLLGRDRVGVDGKLISDPNVYTQRGRTFDNPHIDAAAVRRSMELMSEEQRIQNIEGEFAEGSSLFNAEDVQACYKDQDYAVLMGSDGVPADAQIILKDTEHGVRATLLRDRSKRYRYVMGVDLGRKRDQTCIVVLRMPEPEESPQVCQLVYFALLGNTPWKKQFERIQSVYHQYHCCPTYIDSTAMGGDQTLETLQNEPYNLDVSGYNLAGGQEKDNLIFHLQAAIQEHRVRFPYIKELVNSLTYYRMPDKNLFTDPVFALGFAWEKALEEGMGDAREPYVLITPDLLPMAIARGVNGTSTILGLSDCPICSHPLVELINEFCVKGYVKINGEIVNTESRLIEHCAAQHPYKLVSHEGIRYHQRHLSNERDEDDEFAELFEQRYAARVII